MNCSFLVCSYFCSKLMVSRLRFAVAILFFVIAIVLHIRLGISDAWYLYIASVLLAATHFLFGNIWTAFAELQKGNFLKSEILLNQTRYPDLLLRRPRAYYYLCQGIIALKQEDLVQSELDLKEALKLGLRNDTDRALAKLNLAHIQYKKQNLEQAKVELLAAKNINSTDLLIKQGIEQLEKVLG